MLRNSLRSARNISRKSSRLNKCQLVLTLFPLDHTPEPSCPMRGRFLGAILPQTERKLACLGRPGTVDRLVAKVERREVPRPTSLGARGALPREVGTLIPPQGVPAWCPGASRRSTPSRGSREGLAKLGRIAPRERASVAV